MSVHVNQKPIWPTNYVASEQGPGLFIRRGHAPINLSSKHICHYNSDNRRNISIAIHQQQHAHAPVPHLRISLCSCPGSCVAVASPAGTEKNRIESVLCIVAIQRTVSRMGDWSRVPAHYLHLAASAGGGDRVTYPCLCIPFPIW